jgi:putative ABC transport system substrate-binding protein
MKRREFMAFVGGASSAPLLRPFAAYSQPAGKIPVVGYLWHAGSAEEEQPYYGAIVDGFAHLGYIEGRTIKLEHRFPNEQPERFKSLAAELVALNPDVLMGGAISSSYLKEATSTIPIVFMFVPDPIGLKLVKSFAQPGGNVTGFVNFGRDLVGKRLQSLREIVANLTRVALLVNSDQPPARVYNGRESPGSGRTRLVYPSVRRTQQRSAQICFRRNGKEQHASPHYRVGRQPVCVARCNRKAGIGLWASILRIFKRDLRCGRVDGGRSRSGADVSRLDSVCR